MCLGYTARRQSDMAEVQPTRRDGVLRRNSDSLCSIQKLLSSPYKNKAERDLTSYLVQQLQFAETIIRLRKSQIVCFVVQKLLSLIRSHLFIFGFISNILGGGSQRILLCRRVFCLCSPLGVLQFLVLRLDLESILSLFFVYRVRKCSSFILLQVVDQFSQHQLLKRFSIIHYIFFPPLSKISCLQVC